MSVYQNSFFLMLSLLAMGMIAYIMVNKKDKLKKIGQQIIFLYNKVQNHIIIGMYRKVLDTMPEHKKNDMVSHISYLNGKVALEKDIEKRMQEESDMRDNIKELYEQAGVLNYIDEAFEIAYEKREQYEEIKKAYTKFYLALGMCTILALYNLSKILFN